MEQRSGPLEERGGGPAWRWCGEGRAAARAPADAAPRRGRCLEAGQTARLAGGRKSRRTVGRPRRTPHTHPPARRTVNKPSLLRFYLDFHALEAILLTCMTSRSRLLEVIKPSCIHSLHGSESWQRRFADLVARPPLMVCACASCSLARLAKVHQVRPRPA